MSEKMNYEQKFKRLNEIVSVLEANETPLEEMISLFEEGLGLVKECEAQLKTFEKKVEELTNEKAE